MPLDKHARDKFLRLVGERHDPESDVVTIVTDRCPLRAQNLEYAQYLLTALFHESWVTEPWEATKSEADMEEYIWSRNKSKDAAEAILKWGASATGPVSVPQEYSTSVERLINEGENEQNLAQYKASVLQLLGLSQLPGTQWENVCDR